MRVFSKLHGIDVSAIGNVVAVINLLPPAQNRLGVRDTGGQAVLPRLIGQY
jgi:hypothetical protein